jgi:peroxiredoxin
MSLQAGQPAPDCVLESHLGTRVRLSEMWNQGSLALVFFPLAWTPI